MQKQVCGEVLRFVLQKLRSLGKNEKKKKKKEELLQIVMEYCGAGSISDIMRARRKPLSELEISAVLRDTLKGLQYLHDLKKIHRDIKVGTSFDLEGEKVIIIGF